MFDRILLPADLGDSNRPAVHAAADLADKHGASVTILHVIETVENVEFEELREFYEKLEEKAESALDSLEKTLRQKNIPTRRAIVYGNRLEQILFCAREEETDLIVMASHPVKEGRPHSRWGSISHGVAILAPCSVLLVR